MDRIPDMGEGGGGGGGRSIEARVTRLQESFASINSKVECIESILERLEPKITELFSAAVRQNAFMAFRVDVAEIKGKVSQPPTVWQTIALTPAMTLGLATIVFTAGRDFTP